MSDRLVTDSARMRMVTVKIDSLTEAALAELTADGRSADQVIRDALLIAQRLHRAEIARAEAEMPARNPADRAEAQAIMHDMDELCAW